MSGCNALTRPYQTLDSHGFYVKLSDTFHARIYICRGILDEIELWRKGWLSFNVLLHEFKDVCLFTLLVPEGAGRGAHHDTQRFCYEENMSLRRVTM